MGRPKRYRERVLYEMRSVRAKDVRGLIARTLREEYGRSRIEADVLAGRCVEWLPGLGASAVPGQVRMSVPQIASKRYTSERRTVATITAVDVADDTDVWQQYGTAAVQRHRLVRWILEIHRQGGWASLMELAAWANLTPTALGNRLHPLRVLGVGLPHVGAPDARENALLPEAWLVDRYLTQGRGGGGEGAPRHHRRRLGRRPATLRNHGRRDPVGARPLPFFTQSRKWPRTNRVPTARGQTPAEIPVPQDLPVSHRKTLAMDGLAPGR